MRIPRHWQFALLVALVVLVVFFPVCGFDFLSYDDRLNVRDNPLVRDFSLSSFLRFWRQPFEGLYIPLTYTLWGLVGKIAWGGVSFAPWPFHAANLLLHAATAAVLFLLLRMLVKDDWAAAGGALVFGLHPLVVESVAWITELKGVLSGFLSVLALRQYLIYGASPGKTNNWSSYRLYLLATLYFAAAVLAKPSSLVLPFLAGLLGYLSQSRSGRDVLSEMVPWLVLSLPLAIVTKFAQPDSRLPFVPDLWERVLVAGYAMGFYFLKLLWPVALAPDYGRIPSLLLADKTIYLTGLLPWGLLLAAISKKCRPCLVIVAIPFFSLLPVLGFVPFTFQGTSTVADRYCYLGLIGPALGVAMLLSRYHKRQLQVGVVAVLVGLAALSYNQLSYWKDSPTLDNHINQVNPNSWVAQHSLGSYWQEQDRLEEAAAHYREAIRRKPGYYLSYFNLGYLQFLRGDLDGAAKYFEAVIRMKPDDIPSYNNLGGVYQKMGLIDKAIGVFEKSVVVKGDFARGYLALGRLYALNNRKEDSVIAYQKNLSLEPVAAVFNELGLVCLDLGRLDEAGTAFQKALALGYDSSSGLARLEEARKQSYPDTVEGP